MKISKLKKKITRIFKLSNSDKEFVKFSNEVWGSVNNESEPGEILIDALDYEQYIFLSSYVMNYFSKRYKLKKRYMYFIPANNILGTIKLSIYPIFYRFFRIDKLYQSFGTQLGLLYRKNKAFNLRAIKIKRLQTKEDLLELKIGKTQIGDLVYDSYLRRYSVPTIDIDDKRLYQLINEAYEIYDSCVAYLKNRNVKKIILSHACYIQYGILARVAVERGIDTFSFSKWTNRIVYKLSKEHYLHTEKHLHYKNAFNCLANKENRLNKARSVLINRLNGEIDNGISYMNSTAYHKSKDMGNIFLHNGAPRVIMFLHCFFDSPHFYKDMIFPDFYEWAIHVFEKVKDLNLDFAVKQHPNGLPGNDKIIDDLKYKYPNINFINKNTSNIKIISEKVSAILSVYGTIGSEFAYKGIPVLTAGDNPYSAYDFCYQAKNIQEYDYYLENIDKIPVNLDKKEVESFIYMHYLNPDEGRIEGNNNLFGLTTREYYNPNIFKELVIFAKNGKFDNVFELFSLALKSVGE